MQKHQGAFLIAGLAAMLFSPTLADAQPMGRGGWGGPYGAFPDRALPRTEDSREGRVEVSRFVVAGDAAQALGHGPVSVKSESGDGPWVETEKRSVYEAAIESALIGAGYNTLHPGDKEGQIAQLRLTRQVLVPAEEKRSPVSGTAAVGVGTHGSAYGLGINVDFTKPRAALISTRLDTRIVDANGKVLWEGYATIATREGDNDWSDDRIASKLATALFDNFPKADSIAVPSA